MQRGRRGQRGTGRGRAYKARRMLAESSFRDGKVTAHGSTFGIKPRTFSSGCVQHGSTFDSEHMGSVTCVEQHGSCTIVNGRCPIRAVEQQGATVSDCDAPNSLTDQVGEQCGRGRSATAVCSDSTESLALGDISGRSSEVDCSGCRVLGDDGPYLGRASPSSGLFEVHSPQHQTVWVSEGATASVAGAVSVATLQASSSGHDGQEQG